MAFQAVYLMAHRQLIPRFLLSFAAALAIAPAAMGASSLSNSLKGFTGDSTQVATQNAVQAAGFNFFSTAGLDGTFTMDPTVKFDESGANFGTGFGGDGGRNYMRTVESDYATVDFVAEITFTSTNLSAQDGFFGMGSGDTALFGWPDWSTQFSSVIFTPEIDDSGNPLLTTMYTSNDTPIFNNKAVPSMDSGTHRLRMTYDADAKTVDFAIDLNYAGGPFVQDDAAPTRDVSGLFALPNTFDAADYTVWRNTYGSTTDLTANWTNANSFNVIDDDDYLYWKDHFGETVPGGWPVEPSRIFFGGDDGTIFKDFSVTVTSGAGAGLSGVPEPTCSLLVGLTLACLGGWRRRA